MGVGLFLYFVWFGNNVGGGVFVIEYFGNGKGYKILERVFRRVILRGKFWEINYKEIL